MSLYYCVFGRAAAGITINREARGRGSGRGAGGAAWWDPDSCTLLAAASSGLPWERSWQFGQALGCAGGGFWGEAPPQW